MSSQVIGLGGLTNKLIELRYLSCVLLPIEWVHTGGGKKRNENFNSS